MDKRVQLKIIIKKCEKQFGRGRSEDWKHIDFLEFSNEIQKKTSVNLSINTLKRIFGKIVTDKYYFPQQATFDALIQYCEFNGKEDFNEDSNTIFFSDKPSSYRKIDKYKVGILITLLFSLNILGYFLLNEFSFDNANYSLKFQSSEGTFPKTSFFTVDKPNINDSIFIDFGDRSTLIYLHPNKKTVSHIYFIPGVFKVTLTNRTKEFAKSSVYVSTDNKWIGLGFKRQRYIPKSYYAFHAVKNQDSIFHIPNHELQEQGVDISEKFFVRLCNYASTVQNGDNFIFETTFRKDLSNEGISCNGFVFKISGKNNVILFNFVNPGCSSRIINIVSEKTLDGLTHNLSPFVIDFQKWNRIKLINKNKKLSLFVNNILIYKTSYENSLGNLRGVFVEFERNGFIKDCNLSSLTGTKYYSF